jgi:hypothetical protein
VTDDNSKGPFDPDNLRMDTGETWAAPPTKIEKRRKYFVWVPGIWKERLTKVRYLATYRIALHILMRDFENDGKPFTLSNGAVALEGVKPRAKWRALEELELANLITVEHRERKSPRITVLHTGARRKRVQP